MSDTVTSRFAAKVLFSARHGYAEVLFTDFEDPQNVVRTGYLDRTKREEVAQRLREIANQLEDGGPPA